MHLASHRGALGDAGVSAAAVVVGGSALLPLALAQTRNTQWFDEAALPSRVTFSVKQLLVGSNAPFDRIGAVVVDLESDGVTCAGTHVKMGLREQAASLATVQEAFTKKQGVKLYGEVSRGGKTVMTLRSVYQSKEDRDAVIETLYAALEPGGVLVLSEKIMAGDEQENAWLVERYHDFKRANGYSDLEISQKRTALENVLVPDSLATHHERLARAGFSRSLTWFQFLNFASLIAFKDDRGDAHEREA